MEFGPQEARDCAAGGEAWEGVPSIPKLSPPWKKLSVVVVAALPPFEPTACRAENPNRTAKATTDVRAMPRFSGCREGCLEAAVTNGTVRRDPESGLRRV